MYSLVQSYDFYSWHSNFPGTSELVSKHKEIYQFLELPPPPPPPPKKNEK